MKRILALMILSTLLFGCEDTDLTPDNDGSIQESSVITVTSVDGDVSSFSRTYTYENGLRVATHRDGVLETTRVYANGALSVAEYFDYWANGSEIVRREEYNLTSDGKTMTQVSSQRIASTDPAIHGTLRNSGSRIYNLGAEENTLQVDFYDDAGNINASSIWVVDGQNVVSRTAHDPNGNFLWKVETEYDLNAFNPNWNLTGHLSVGFESQNIPLRVKYYNAESGQDVPASTEEHSTILNGKGYPTEWSYTSSDGYQWKINWKFR